MTEVAKVIALLALPVYVLAVALEIGLARLKVIRAHYEARDTAASLGMSVGAGLIGGLFAGLSFAAMQLVYEQRVFTMPMTAGWPWLLLFLLDDLTYYVFHRISHERRLWWAAHVNHHSSQHFNLATALRQPWTGKAIATWAFWLPLCLLGFPPEAVAAQTSLNLFYQFWIHTEGVGRLPAWVEAVFNTPSHHRVHHARNPIYLDRNYGGVLIVWDRLFGTFQRERPDTPCRYGLISNLGTFNLARVAFHEWAALVADVVRAPRYTLGWLFGPPGWSPDGSRATTRSQRARVLSPSPEAPPAGAGLRSPPSA